MKTGSQTTENNFCVSNNYYSWTNRYEQHELYICITHLPSDIYTEIDSSFSLLKCTIKIFLEIQRGDKERSGQNVKMNEKKITVFQTNVLIIIWNNWVCFKCYKK